MSRLDPIRLVADRSEARGLALFVALRLAVLLKPGMTETRPTSYGEVAKSIGISHKSVSRSVSTLMQLGEWSTHGGRGRSARTIFKLELRAFVGANGFDVQIGDAGAPLTGEILDSRTRFPPKRSQADRQSRSADYSGTELSTSTCTLAAAFERFWSEYPRKVAKVEARSAWMRHVTPDIVERVIDAVIAQRQSRDWLKNQGQFIPHAATWLRGERWEDELPRDSGRLVAPIVRAPDYAAKRAASLQRAIARLTEYTGPLAAECRHAANALRNGTTDVAAVDRVLIEATKTVLDMSEVEQDATERMASLRTRMKDEDYQRALEAQVHDIVRQRLRIPDLRPLINDGEQGPVEPARVWHSETNDVR